MQRDKMFQLYLNNLSLPKIKKRTGNKNNFNTFKITNTNPNLKRRIEDYKINFNFKLPKLETHSPRYHQILTSENVKELAKNYLQGNKDIFSYLKEKGEVYQEKLKEKLEKKEPKNSYSNKIKIIVRQHSSKYHPDNDIRKQPLNDFDVMLNKLKYGSYNFIDVEDREIKYRQRLAFKYRFLKNEKNNLARIDIDKMNLKMNRLLGISKSIPNYLLIKKNNNNNNINDVYNDNTKQKEEEDENKKTISINNSLNFSSRNNIHKKCKIFDFSSKRKGKSEENIKSKNNNSDIISFDKNGKKYIRHLSLIL